MSSEPRALPCSLTKDEIRAIIEEMDAAPDNFMWSLEFAARIEAALKRKPSLPPDVPDGCVRVRIPVRVFPTESGAWSWYTDPKDPNLIAAVLVADVPIPRAPEVVAHVEVKP